MHTCTITQRQAVVVQPCTVCVPAKTTMTLHCAVRETRMMDANRCVYMCVCLLVFGLKKSVFSRPVRHGKLWHVQYNTIQHPHAVNLPGHPVPGLFIVPPPSASGGPEAGCAAKMPLPQGGPEGPPADRTSHLHFFLALR